ncbi:DUF6477 family protein [Neogemmobacter tilapiae]|uniref:Uncharacterized protein n=1 Tax=Neogemmobacter tilapiae TaxID=875041 RepID=A0A918TEB4_9RHOB|nr:DUF6477 family protein [Gemmobacter tilapiae]GHC44307.1 hypothetical protein GCM10007315_01850 [Gemmobacter tilapiae]
MTDLHKILETLRRPGLLMRAARFGLPDYRRDRDLRRLLPGQANTSPEKLVPRLLSEEEILEQSRQSGDLSYSISRHIEVLIALISEARLLPRPANSLK